MGGPGDTQIPADAGGAHSQGVPQLRLSQLPEEVLCRILKQLDLKDLISLVSSGLEQHSCATVEDEIIERTRLLHSRSLTAFLRIYPLAEPRSARVREATAAMLVRRIKDLTMRALAEAERQFPEVEVQSAIRKEATRRITWCIYVTGDNGDYEESFRSAEPVGRLSVEYCKKFQPLYEDDHDWPDSKFARGSPITWSLSCLMGGRRPSSYHLDRVTEYGEPLYDDSWLSLYFNTMRKDFWL